MQWLLNLDMGDNKRIIKMEDVKELDIDFKRLKTTFGTTDFTWDQGLDAIGMDEVCVVLDLEGATRYVKMGEKEFTNDMSKGVMKSAMQSARFTTRQTVSLFAATTLSS